MPTATIDGEIIIRTEKTLAELRKLPGVTEAEARKMASTLSREWSKAEKETAKSQQRMAAEFRKAFEVANREAEQAADEAARHARRIADEAAKAAHRAREESARVTETITKKLAGQLGGDVAEIADVAFEAGGAIGAVGVAGLGAVAGVAALAGVTKRVADYALEARDRLTEQGLASQLPPAALASLRDYEAASSDLRREIDLAAVSIGGPMSEGLSIVADSAARATREFRELGDAHRQAVAEQEAATGQSEFYVAVMDAVSLGLTKHIRENREAAAEKRRFVEEVNKESQALEDQLATYYHLAQAKKEAFVGPVLSDEDLLAGRDAAKAEAEKKAAEAARKAAAAAREAARADAEWTQHRRKLSAAVADSGEELKESAGKAAFAEEQAAKANEEWRKSAAATAQGAQDLRREVDELSRSGAMSSSAGGLAVQVWAEQLEGFLDSPVVRAVGDLGSQWADQFIDANQRQIDASQDLHRQLLDNFREERDARRESIDEWVDGEREKLDRMRERGDLSRQEYREELRRLEGAERHREEAARKLTLIEQREVERRRAAERSAAMEAFRENQRLQIIQATMESFRAAVSLIPAFAFAGPAAPVLAADVALIGAGLQIANIQAQQPPEFPMGRLPGSPDHTVDARLQPTESVNTERGTEILGRDRIERASRGQMTPSVFHLHIGRRTVSAVVADEMGRATLDPRAGKRAPGRR